LVAATPGAARQFSSGLSVLKSQGGVRLKPPVSPRRRFGPEGLPRVGRRFNAGSGVWTFCTPTACRHISPGQPPWEKRRATRTRPARAGAVASIPKVTLIECHLVALQRRSEFSLKGFTEGSKNEVLTDD
jgi:hypothetical protein